MSALKETKPAVRATRGSNPRAARPAGRDGSRLTRQQSRAGWWLLAPALLHSTFFLAVPAVVALFLSFTNYDFSGTWQLIGTENYVELFQDTRFQAALRNTVAYTLVVVPLAMVLALLIALGLTGWFASWLTGLPALRLVRRNVVLGGATMAASLLIGLVIVR